MISPGPLVDSVTTVAALGVVATVAPVKVMLPVWLLSPMVTVPVEVVRICANSALVRLTPLGARLVPPI